MKRTSLLKLDSLHGDPQRPGSSLHLLRKSMIDLPILTIAATITATIITINRNMIDLPRGGASLNTGPSLQELFHSK